MRRLFLLVGLVVVLLLALPVAAQEVTAVPDVPPVIVVPADSVPMTGAQLLLYLVLAAFGGGGLLAILFRFLDRKEARDTGEKLYQSMAPEHQKFVKEVVEGYRQLSSRLLAYLEAITDGLPNEEASAISGKEYVVFPEGVHPDAAHEFLKQAGYTGDPAHGGLPGKT